MFYKIGYLTNDYGTPYSTVIIKTDNSLTAEAVRELYENNICRFRPADIEEVSEASIECWPQNDVWDQLYLVPEEDITLAQKEQE